MSDKAKHVVIGSALLVAAVFIAVRPTHPDDTIVSTVYGDQLAARWLRDAWGSVTSVDQSSVVQSGTSAIEVSVNAEWAAFVLGRRESNWSQTYPIQPNEYTHLSFDINAGSAVSPALATLALNLNNDSDGAPLSNFISIDQSNHWYHARVPLAAINQQNTAYFELVFFNNSQSTSFGFYLDNIALENDGSATPTPTPTPTPAPPGAPVTFSINTSKNRGSISPYIYGVNWADDAVVTALGGHIALYRSGGNRWTGYNWENNASNAGTDWGPNSSDGYLSDSEVPGQAVRERIASAHARNGAALITIPIVDYVAADKSGIVTTVADPDNPRWRQNQARKGSPLSLTPDTADPFVNEDEHVNWVEATFTAARAHGKDIMYSLDNEPGLWNSTHPLIHPDATTYAEMATRTVETATMIKDLASNAKVFGAVCYGFNEFINLQDAPDANGRDYLNFILDEWRSADVKQSRRVVDVLDLHWYPEATGGGVRISNSDSADPSAGEIEARVQAPRSLWDPAYREISWISDYLDWQNDHIRLLPRLKDQIANHYPGTGLAFTEYYYGGAGHISGAIAQAEVLGIFGREGVYAASLWGDVADFILGGFAAFLNYDGAGRQVGDTSVFAATSDTTRTSAYAFASSADNARLWAIAVNKTADTISASLEIAHSQNFTGVNVYRITAAQALPQSAGVLPIASNQVAFEMPAYSVSTLEFTSATSTRARPKGLRLR